MEYEFFSMSKPTIEGIKSFTQFRLEITQDGENGKQGDVIRDIYDRVSPTSDNYTYTKDDGDDISNVSVDGSFNAFLAKTFPRALSLYAISFPSFIYMSNSEMKKALLAESKKSELYSPYAVSFRLIVGQNANKLWAPVAKDLGKEEWKSSFVKCAKHLIDNPDMLEPPKIEKTVTKAEKTATKAEKTVTIKTEKTDKKIGNKIKFVPLYSKNSFDY